MTRISPEGYLGLVYLRKVIYDSYLSGRLSMTRISVEGYL